VGRSPRVTGYGLEELGIPLTPRKTIETNEYLQTLYPNIYAVGDVAGPFQFTHTAAHQAWYAAVNALFGRFKQVQGRLPRDPLGHLHRPRGGARGPEREEAKEQGIALRGDEATASTTSTAPSPTAPRTASSRCSPCPARTASWA
jgi:pyruvate/2-oxoglutarate dehydrogenase complex dihydrolipoamide dehydrogenase (E3) component